MQKSLELYFLVNFAVDTALIAVVARANECLRMQRVFLCGLLAASYALLAQTVSLRLTSPAIQILLLAILSMILVGDSSIPRFGSLSIQLLGGAMILGGTGALFPSSSEFPAALIGAGLILTGVVLSIRTSRLITWDVTVLIALKGKSVNLRALIDTGNRLREPISGLPVIIAESEALKPLFSDLSFDRLPCRQVAFGALGGRGTIRAFRPDCVLIRRGDRFVRAPEVWVAVYPGRIPGPTRALAPPSFAVIPGGRIHPPYKIQAKRGDI